MTQTLKSLKEEKNNLLLDGNITSYAAGAALQVLIEHWNDAVSEGHQLNQLLDHDLANVIAKLQNILNSSKLLRR